MNLNFQEIFSKVKFEITGKHTKSYMLEVSRNLCKEVLDQMRVRPENKSIYIDSFVSSVEFIVDLYDNEEEFNKFFFLRNMFGHDLYFLTPQGKRIISGKIAGKIFNDDLALPTSTDKRAATEADAVMNSFNELLNYFCTSKQIHPEKVQTSVEFQVLPSEIKVLIESEILDGIRGAYLVENQSKKSSRDVVFANEVDLESEFKGLSAQTQRSIVKFIEEIKDCLKGAKEKDFVVCFQDLRDLIVLDLKSDVKDLILLGLGNNKEQEVLEFTVKGKRHSLKVDLNFEYEYFQR